MKKTKIILPALGLLLLSTAASVTGTVAWFTSVSTVNSGLNSFAVKRVGGNLAIAIKTAADGATYGVGTALSQSGDSVVYASQTYLTHGSYDHVNHLVGKPTNGAASEFTTFADSTADSGTSPWCVAGADGNKYYYAVTWTLIFTYTYGSDEAQVNLYFDSAASTVTRTNSDAGDLQTYKGFRLAFVSGKVAGASSSTDLLGRNVVWAKNQTYDKCKFIDADTTIDNGTYTSAGAYGTANSTASATDLIDSTGMTAISESSTGSATRTDYLGQFSRSGSETEDIIYVKVVAWYEGTDENVVNAATLDTVASAMTFYTRTAEAADASHAV